MTANVSPVSALRIIYTWATHDIEHGKKKALEPVSVADLCERALKSAASASGGVPEWLPIDTAPKTGREKILLLTPSGWPQVAWSNTWWTCGFSFENKPTHWMPLPPDPTAQADHIVHANKMVRADQENLK